MSLIDQTGSTIRFTAFYTTSAGVGVTGLVVGGTILVDIYNPAGALIVNGDTVVEVGGGLYYYDLSNTLTNSAGVYLAVFRTTDGTVDKKQISDRYLVGAPWVENLDQAVSSRSTLTAANVWTYGTRSLTTYGQALSNPVTAPTINVTGGGSVGGSLQAGAYYAKYTWTNTAGETLASPESLVFTVSAGNIPRVTFPSLPTGATGYNLYLTQAAGASGTGTLYATGLTLTTYDISAATVTGHQPPPTVNTTNDLVTSIWNASDRELTAFNFNVTVGSNNDKTGYSLAASGLDAIAITDPGNVANINSLPKMIVALYRYWYKTSSMTASSIKLFADDDTTVNNTMAVSDDGTTQTKGAAT